jgi:hypothetical protein
MMQRMASSRIVRWRRSPKQPAKAQHLQRIATNLLKRRRGVAYARLKNAPTKPRGEEFAKGTEPRARTKYAVLKAARTYLRREVFAVGTEA